MWPVQVELPWACFVFEVTDDGDHRGSTGRPLTGSVEAQHAAVDSFDADTVPESYYHLKVHASREQRSNGHRVAATRKPGVPEESG